jgi:hypothetical protein
MDVICDTMFTQAASRVSTRWRAIFLASSSDPTAVKTIRLSVTIGPVPASVSNH